jgi:hypothetical protein
MSHLAWNPPRKHTAAAAGIEWVTKPNSRRGTWVPSRVGQSARECRKRTHGMTILARSVCHCIHIFILLVLLYVAETVVGVYSIKTWPLTFRMAPVTSELSEVNDLCVGRVSGYRLDMWWRHRRGSPRGCVGVVFSWVALKVNSASRNACS